MIIRQLIFLLSVLFATQALASDLTVEDCVRLGLEQNSNLKATAAEVEIYTQEARIALAELYPSVSLESSYIMRDQSPRLILESGLFGPGLPPSDTKIEGEKEHYTVGVRLTQPLFAGGKLVGTHQSKNFLVEARRYQLEDQTSQLIYQIKNSFYQVLNRQYELAGTAEAVSTHAEELRIIKELLSAGKATRDQILAAKSKLLFAKTDRLQAEQAYQNALADLGAMLGTEESIMVVEPKFYATLSPEFEILGGVVANKRKDLKRLGAQISAADKNVQVARSVYYPQLNLEASYLNQRETNITAPDIWEAGLRLEWSLFEAGKTDAEVAKAKAEHLRLKHLRADLERSVDNEVKAALRLVRENEALVEAHRLQLLATEQEYAYQLELYHAGKQKKLDVLTSRVRLATENARYRVSINHLRTSLVALETALSMPIEGQLTTKEPHQITLESLDAILSTPSSPPVLKARPKSLLPDNYTYAIQLGAFRSAEKAGLFLNSLKKDFPNKTFGSISTGGWQKVRAIHFATHEAASVALVELGGKGLIIHANTNHRRPD